MAEHCRFTAEHGEKTAKNSVQRA